MSLILAHSGCGGGQTGQPTSDKPPKCEEGEVSNGWECCLEVGPERVGEFSARELVEEHASTKVPLFWSPLPESRAEVTLFEPGDAEEDELTASLELDESVPSLACNDRVEVVPVVLSLSTQKGYESQFAAWLWSTNGGTRIFLRDEQPVRLPPDVTSLCDLSLEFSEQGLVGRFCDEERVATFPTACGGIAQAAPEEALFAETLPPADWFANFDHVTLSSPDLPPLTLTLRIDDTTACYDSTSSYVLEASVQVETGGARFEASRLSTRGYSDEPSERSERGYVRRVEIPKFGADVSASPDWAAVMAELGVEGPLYLSGGFGMKKDGSCGYFFAGGFEYGPEWAFTGP